MKLTQVKGNTWVLEGFELIPLYRLENNTCILLDTGLKDEREDIENSLLEAGLTPAGILCSHAHIDHAGNNRYFQEKYHIPVALTAREAGMCASILSLKCYFLLLPPDMVERESSNLVHTPDVIIPDQDGSFSFAGAEFTILHTPGHSPGHLCWWEEDRGSLYAGDLLYKGKLDMFYPTTDPAAFLTSVRRAAALPVKTLRPGHHSLDVTPTLAGQVLNALETLARAGELIQGRGIVDFDDFSIHL